MSSNIPTIIHLVELFGLLGLTDCAQSTVHTYEFTICPSGFQSFEASCYRLVSDSPTDGYTARTECQKLANDSHLVFIQSQSEMTFLQGLATGEGAVEDYWFGLTYTDDTVSPHWLDGSALGDFTAWDSYGAFDDSSPCVRLRRQSSYLWNDRICDHYYYGYICEVETASSQYTFVTEQLSWSDARDACASADSHLGIINSEQEYLGLEAATSSLSIPSSHYWIGLLPAVSADTVTWLDGTALAFSPGNFEVDGGSECYTMDLGSGDWSGWDCTKTNNYICEEGVIDLTPTPEGVVGLISTPEGVASLMSTLEVVVNPTTTPQGVVGPTTTSAGLRDPTTTPEGAVDLTTSPEGAVDLTTSPEGVVDPTTTPTGVVEPTTTLEGVVDSITTPEGTSHYQSLAPLTIEGEPKLATTTPGDNCESNSPHCRSRSLTYHLHATAKTLPAHLILQTVKGIRSDLRCASACLAEDGCRCFIVLSNNDCLLSAAGTDEAGLFSHESAQIYCMEEN